MLSHFTIIVFILLLIKTTTPTNNNVNYLVPRFRRFLDVSKGINVEGISGLKRFFHRFGYLIDENNNMNFTNTFDDRFEVALVKFQSNLGLPVTGKLDGETLSLIASPRCGVSDDVVVHAKRNYAFFADRPRWNRAVPMTLTYAFSPEYTIKGLTGPEIKNAIKNAFGHWAKVVPVTFVETGDYGFADIKIGFYSGEHGDGEPFDGVLGILAHAFSPESGRFHLDAAETWTVDMEVEKSDVAVDLESVATHEIGHLLGLAHTSDPEAVMYPSLKPRQRKVELNLDDVKAIQGLYGSNPNFSYSDFSESDISSNSNAGFGFNNLSLSHYWFIILLAILFILYV